MRLRIGIGMARMSTLCHKSLSLASYIIYGNALAVIEGKVKPSIQTVRQILEVCLRHPDPILRECAAAAMGKDRWPESGLQPPLT
jgi:hypothetical protein